MADDLAMATRILDVAGHRASPTRRAASSRRTWPATRAARTDASSTTSAATSASSPPTLYERFAFYFDAFPQIRREVD